MGWSETFKQAAQGFYGKTVLAAAMAGATVLSACGVSGSAYVATGTGYRGNNYGWNYWGYNGGSTCGANAYASYSMFGGAPYPYCVSYNTGRVFHPAHAVANSGDRLVVWNPQHKVRGSVAVRTASLQVRGTRGVAYGGTSGGQRGVSTAKSRPSASPGYGRAVTPGNGSRTGTSHRAAPSQGYGGEQRAVPSGGAAPDRPVVHGGGQRGGHSAPVYGGGHRR